MGHALMENRHGLAVDGGVTSATGTAEREATLEMLDRRPGRRRITLGARTQLCSRDWNRDPRIASAAMPPIGCTEVLACIDVTEAPAIDAAG